MDISVGSVLTVVGEWKIDSKFGRQFVATEWEETLPATVYGIEKYLGSGLIKGIGPKYAKKIVAQFGEQTLEIIESESERLIEVPGIGGRRVTMIRDGWARQKEIKNVMLFLQTHDVSTAHAARIYKAYGNDSIKTVTGIMPLIDEQTSCSDRSHCVFALMLTFIRLCTNRQPQSAGILM